MTDQPTDSPAQPNPNEPPPEIQAILDEASDPSDPSGQYAALIALPDTMKLVDAKTKQVIREVRWAGLYSWSRAILDASLQSVNSYTRPPATIDPDSGVGLPIVTPVPDLPTA